VSPAKTAGPIKMLFGFGLGWARGTMHMGVQIPPWEGAILRGKEEYHCKV